MKSGWYKVNKKELGKWLQKVQVGKH